MLQFFKSLWAKIKDKLIQRAAKHITENMTPIMGTIIYLEKYPKGKIKYKVVIKNERNRTVMLKIKNKVSLKQGDKIQGYYSKEDRTALVEVA